MTKQWIFPIANFLFKGSMGIFADYKAVGKENIPASGPAHRRFEPPGDRRSGGRRSQHSAGHHCSWPRKSSFRTR